MRKIIFTIALLASSLLMNATAIGTWKAYMAYHDITEIQKGGNNLYILASDNLYSYNQNDQSVRTYDKANVLSDCNITHIAWCQAAKRLVITYKDENIDLLNETGNVTNISDYYSKSMTEDKTINSIDIADKYAYLSTGFGILKLNIADGEISDTYNLGFKVNYSYISNGKIYAASNDKGLYSALLTANLLDKSNWSRVGDYVARNTTIDPDLLAKAQSANPGGPKYNYFGFLKFYNGSLYTCGGGYSAIEDLFRPGCVQVMKGDDWTIYQDDIAAKIGHVYLDMNSVAIDPNDVSRVFIGGRTGLYEFKDGSFIKEYTYENSPLRGSANVSATNKEYTLVQGITFDNNSSLWCLNSGSATTSILEMNKNDEWISHHKTSLMRDGRTIDMLESPFFDSRNYLWFVNNHFNYACLACYQPSTDDINTYFSFINEDGTTVKVTYVRCVIEDLEHNIWIGTDAGPLMLEPSEFTESSPIFQQIKVPRNDGTDYADYLLSGIDITCMAIDGGGRKWFGTNGNGVYLISDDNLTQIHHFLSTNSKLLSNNIESIAINETTGEVFIGTDCGLCSYMSDATQSSTEMTKDNVYAYPNPVRPDYTGLITITGLSYNADIKIVTSNGVLVNEGKSNGGTYTWNGCDQKGRRVASGVYMVETATSEGNKGVVCKIAIVN
jgi:hypothetical protein